MPLLLPLPLLPPLPLPLLKGVGTNNDIAHAAAASQAVWRRRGSNMRR
ncbi:MAG: hypothetical protein H6835_19775 [Planctomycetes bacterium]|nr:hypothetical protein [Planctomycetota bacterium]